jgi:Phosphotransferase enzyme family
MLMPALPAAAGSLVDTCLDPQAMQGRLRGLFAAQGELEAVRVVKARRSASQHRAPHPLVLCYELDLRHGGKLSTLSCCGKVFRHGASAQAAREHGNALHIPELDLLLWPWPADPALPQLQALLQPACTEPFWGQAAAAVQVQRYEPERRATLRYTGPAGQVLYAKTFAGAKAGAVWQRFESMWQLSECNADAPRVARPLPGGDAAHTLWQEAATGTPLLQLLDNASALALPLAHAVATIHQLPVALAGPAARNTEHWLAEVGRRRQKIGRVLPELAGRADRLARSIEDAAARLPAHQPCVIHGDFHAEQTWFDGQRIVLFDFDEFVLGDPMEDLAEFIVKLPAGAAAERLAERWLHAYAQIAPQHFCHQRLAWHSVVQQLLQASRAFVFQVADWRGQVQRRLARAELLAAGMDSGSAA